MDREDLQGLLRRQPFESIGITTHDGATRHILHPECIALGAKRMLLIDPATDRVEFIPYAAISSVSTWEKQSA
jgi:hypothetical protein